MPQTTNKDQANKHRTIERIRDSIATQSTRILQWFTDAE